MPDDGRGSAPFDLDAHRGREVMAGEGTPGDETRRTATRPRKRKRRRFRRSGRSAGTSHVTAGVRSVTVSAAGAAGEAGAARAGASGTRLTPSRGLRENDGRAGLEEYHNRIGPVTWITHNRDDSRRTTPTTISRTPTAPAVPGTFTGESGRMPDSSGSRDRRPPRLSSSQIQAGRHGSCRASPTVTGARTS